MTPDRWARVEGLLAEGWSPEQVAGRLRLEGGWAVGRQWTSEHVRADGKAGGGLFPLLRRRGKRPNWRGGRHSGRGHIPGHVDISGRPEEAGSRERVGDREADTIIGKGHSGAVVSLVDRAPEYTYSRRVDRRTSAAVSAAMVEMPPSAVPVHTITADNGKEFAGHAGVAEALRAGFFLPTPQHSWERGPTGHTNGLVRRYLPKGTDLRLRAWLRRREGMEWISGSRPSGRREGAARPEPGRTLPAPAEALRRPESPDNLHPDGTTAVPGPDPRCPGAGNHAFRPFPPLGLRPRCGNGRRCTSEWKWGC